MANVYYLRDENFCYYTNNPLDASYTLWEPGKNVCSGRYVYIQAHDNTFSLPESVAGLFTYCTNDEFPSMWRWTTSDVTDFSKLFSNCNNLTTVDLSNFDTSNATNMQKMFYSCDSLVSADLSTFDTSNVTDMSFMFVDCTSLKTLNLSSFDTSNVTNMGSMFLNCTSLNDLDLSSFNTSKVTNMASMFEKCGAKTINVSNFDTSKVLTFRLMFMDCKRVTHLDLSSFTMASDARDFILMFKGCDNLISIDLSNWRMPSYNLFHDVMDMFADCPNLRKIIVPPNSDWKMYTTHEPRERNGMFLNSVNLPGYSVAADLWGSGIEKANNMGGYFSVLMDWKPAKIYIKA